MRKLDYSKIGNSMNLSRFLEMLQRVDLRDCPSNESAKMLTPILFSSVLFNRFSKFRKCFIKICLNEGGWLLIKLHYQ